MAGAPEPASRSHSRIACLKVLAKVGAGAECPVTSRETRWKAELSSVAGGRDELSCRRWWPRRVAEPPRALSSSGGAAVSFGAGQIVASLLRYR